MDGAWGGNNDLLVETTTTEVIRVVTASRTYPMGSESVDQHLTNDSVRMLSVAYNKFQLKNQVFQLLFTELKASKWLVPWVGTKFAASTMNIAGELVQILTPACAAIRTPSRALELHVVENQLLRLWQKSQRSTSITVCARDDAIFIPNQDTVSCRCSGHTILRCIRAYIQFVLSLVGLLILSLLICDGCHTWSNSLFVHLVSSSFGFLRTNKLLLKQKSDLFRLKSDGSWVICVTASIEYYAPTSIRTTKWSASLVIMIE